MRRRSTVTCRLVAAVVACALRAIPAVAQQTDSVPLATSTWMVGGTVMVPQAGGSVDASLSALGLSVGTLRPNTLGADLAFVVLPRGLQAGVLAAGVRANVALPIGIGRRALLVPSAGLSLLGAVGVGGVGGIRGLNGTMALIIFDRPTSEPGSSYGLRIALAHHRFSSDGGLQMLEVGFVRRTR